MRLIVIGKHGQLARSLAERGAARGVDCVFIGKPEFDLAFAERSRLALEVAADAVVNAAAYTAVDKAESEADLAMAVNCDGVRVAAEASAKRNLPFIHVSTDYVFNGRLDRPYREDDPVDPLGVYGRSKLTGEHAVAAANPRSVIVRTSWVYSPFGHNFVRTMLRLGETRPRINVVADQRGSPTSALDLADALISISASIVQEPYDAAKFGVFHATGAGEASWAEFAQTLFDDAALLGRPPVAVDPISTAEYPTPAKRPANSRLDNGKLRATFGLQMPDWRTSVADCVRRLVKPEHADIS